MGTPAYPPPYLPPASPTIPGGDTTFILRELVKVSQTLAGTLNMLPAPAIAAPANPQIGMVRKSLAPWRPLSGQTADKWVIFGPTGWEPFT